MMHTNYLFAYGTLQSAHAPAEIASTVARLEPMGKGWVRGTLYHLGTYPGAVLGHASARKIFGTVFRLPDQQILRQLDDYEGFHPHDARCSLFVRQLQTVTLADSRRLRCWIYVYNRPTAARRVLTGKYLKAKIHDRDTEGTEKSKSGPRIQGKARRSC